MNVKTALLAVLVFSAFLVGCTSSQTGTGYAAYNQQQGQQQQQNGQYVGGGCGVAPSAAYEDTPSAKIFNSVENF